MIKEINDSIIYNMKQGNPREVLALKGLKAELENNLKEKSPKETIEVINSYKNKLVKALDAFKGMPEKEELLMSEIKIVEKFLPEQLSPVEITALISEVISGLQEEKEQNISIGLVMKVINPLVKGRCSGKVLVEKIKEALN